MILYKMVNAKLMKKIISEYNKQVKESTIKGVNVMKSAEIEAVFNKHFDLGMDGKSYRPKKDKSALTEGGVWNYSVWKTLGVGFIKKEKPPPAPKIVKVKKVKEKKVKKTSTTYIKDKKTGKITIKEPAPPKPKKVKEVEKSMSQAQQEAKKGIDLSQKFIKLIEDNKTALENDKWGKGSSHRNAYIFYKSRIGVDNSIKSNTEKINLVKKRLKNLKSNSEKIKKEIRTILNKHYGEVAKLEQKVLDGKITESKYDDKDEELDDKLDDDLHDLKEKYNIKNMNNDTEFFENMNDESKKYINVLKQKSFGGFNSIPNYVKANKIGAKIKDPAPNKPNSKEKNNMESIRHYIKNGRKIKGSHFKNVKELNESIEYLKTRKVEGLSKLLEELKKKPAPKKEKKDKSIDKLIVDVNSGKYLKEILEKENKKPAPKKEKKKPAPKKVKK